MSIFSSLSGSAALGVFLLATCAFALQVDEQLDQDPVLAGCGGADRVLKWILSDSEGSSLLTPEWLDSVILRWMRGTEAQKVVSEDLRRGDGLLADALEESFELLHIGGQSARDEVRKLTEKKESQLWWALIGNPRSIAPLRRYVLQMPEDGPSRLFALSAWWSKEGQTFPDSVMETALRAVNAPITCAPQDWEERWEQGKKLSLGENTARGTLYVLGRFPRKAGTFYDLVWQQCWQQLTTDPAYWEEYQKRLMQCKAAYRFACQSLVHAFHTPEGKKFFEHYLGVDPIHSQLVGRGRWLWEGLVGKDRPYHPAFQDIAYQRLLQKLSAGDERYQDFFLWHLTRPAEALSEAAREALTEAMIREESIARLALESIWDAGPLWINRLEQTAAWRSGEVTKDKTTSDIRRAYAQGELTRDSLLAISGEIALFLRASDWAWSSLFCEGAAKSLSAFLRRSVPKLPLFSPSYALAWADTLLQNDPEAFRAFGQWVALRKPAEGGMALSQYPSWLKRADDQLRTAIRQGSVIFNEEAQRFIDLFVQWSDREGWNVVENHLKRETLLAQELRELLMTQWRMDRDAFWKWYGILCHLPAAESLRERTSEAITIAGAAADILDGVASFDYGVADASVPIWTELWKDASKRQMVCRAILQADGLSELNSLLVQATENTVELPSEKELIARMARGMGKLPQDEEITSLLRRDPGITRTLVAQCLESNGFRERWEKSVFLSIELGGQAPFVAHWIHQKKDAVNAWKEAFAKALEKSPPLLSYAIRRMAAARGGDLFWGAEIRKLEDTVMTTVSTERLFWENLLTDKTGGIESYAKQKFPSNP
ncbi:conserved exported hypothetical protein [Candidatus Methylacidithermus pantelleriae]|uniref:DUF4034 domain-containing protein n=1 Tax=Candidatus Methylacidithermus pantelleriae TaxID=2744239 RepID=A0A8J2BSS6_9BACT|nr:conserved exported hypothetical protein [Candidatus Methylacidithermus pantelleriae]